MSGFDALMIWKSKNALFTHKILNLNEVSRRPQTVPMQHSEYSYFFKQLFYYKGLDSRCVWEIFCRNGRFLGANILKMYFLEFIHQKPVRVSPLYRQFGTFRWKLTETHDKGFFRMKESCWTWSVWSVRECSIISSFWLWIPAKNMKSTNNASNRSMHINGKLSQSGMKR
jgi:hypothetical protein